MPNLPLYRQGQSTLYQSYSSNAVVGISFQHAKIHQENHYFHSNYVELDNIGTRNISLTTLSGSETEIHVRYSINAAGAATIELYEGATISDGSSITPYNNQRNSSNTTELVMKQDPTITAPGTRISNNKYGTGLNGPSNLLGGSDDLGNELILKYNTTYTINITSNDDNNVIDYHIYYYEN